MRRLLRRLLAAPHDRFGVDPIRDASVWSWPTAAVPYVRRKRVLEESGSCREGQLTGLVANSRNRPAAAGRQARLTTPKADLLTSSLHRHALSCAYRPGRSVRLQCAFMFEAQPFGNAPASFVLVVCPTPDSARPDVPEGELRNAARRLGCQALALEALPAPPTDLEYAGFPVEPVQTAVQYMLTGVARNPNIGKSARSSQFAAPRRANSSSSRQLGSP